MKIACSAGAGDCDSDSDCFGDLRCGSNNCQGQGFDDSDDCCYREGNQIWTIHQRRGSILKIIFVSKLATLNLKLYPSISLSDIY